MTMRNQRFWASTIRFAYRKVGGLHFIALGNITISLSVSNPNRNRQEVAQ